MDSQVTVSLGLDSRCLEHASRHLLSQSGALDRRPQIYLSEPALARKKLILNPITKSMKKTLSSHQITIALLGTLLFSQTSLSALELKTADYKVTKATNQDRSGYSIDLSYPKFQLSDPKKERLLNQLAFAPYKEQANTFVAGMRLDPPASGRLPHLGGSFNKVFDNEKLVAVMYNAYFETGGAHPSPLLISRVFAIEEPRVVFLENFFRKKSSFLPRLSQLSRVELYKALGEKDEWVDRGTEPTLANFNLFYPTQEGLTIVFPPYQVASYVEGVKTVAIPWSKLSDIVDPIFFSRHKLNLGHP
jgi:hypothetical protein